MNTRMRTRYLDDSVSTATPGTLLVRLYDRLLLDLSQSEAAINRGDATGAISLITHAQDIITELHATLKVDLWSGGVALAQIYEYALNELLQASVRADAERVATVRVLFEPLRDAWAEAARITERDRAADMAQALGTLSA